MCKAEELEGMKQEGTIQNLGEKKIYTIVSWIRPTGVKKSLKQTEFNFNELRI